MPRLRFKNFSDLGFIQGIDKPHHLAPLLVPHTEYFGRDEMNDDLVLERAPNDRESQTIY